MDDTAQKLAAMFEGDGSEPGWPSGVGWRPWWPRAGELWDARGVCPELDRSPAHTQRIWAEAWSTLERLHAEYLEAKEAK